MPGALATEGRDAHLVYGHLGVLVLVFASIARILKWVPPGFARHEGGKTTSPAGVGSHHENPREIAIDCRACNQAEML
jgi:hypothetical protein